MNGVDPLGEKTEGGQVDLSGGTGKSLSSLSPCQDQIYKSMLAAAGINAYIHDYAGEKQAAWVDSHRWDFYLLPPALAVGVVGGAVACAYGVCEAIGAGGGAVAAQQAVQDAEDEGWGSSAAMTSEEQATFDDVANNGNNLSHVFDNPNHNFAAVISEFGGQLPGLQALSIAINQESDILPPSGAFINVPVVLGNAVVGVNGIVINGIVRKIGRAHV